VRFVIAFGRILIKKGTATTMAFPHRNSQKRIYEEGAEYFITSVTHERFPYFDEPILAELFVRDLWFAMELKQFDLYGFTVMPDHVHLLIQPKEQFNYSQIMATLKRNVARDINNIIEDKSLIRDLHEGDDSNRRLRTNFEKTERDHPHLRFDAYSSHFTKIEQLRRNFNGKQSSKQSFPAFRWQKSFLDHIIRDEEDYLNHLEYIYNNAVKHGLVTDAEQHPFMWIIGMKEPFTPD
jgi:REP element-mobilizing transposase RayT